MKNLVLIVLFLFAAQNQISAQDIIELGASENMSITGKGPGQDAAINPFINTNSIAIIENIGENAFSIRVQKDKKILKEITIKAKEKKAVTLLKGYELYFDSTKKAKAKVDFKKAPAY